LPAIPFVYLGYAPWYVRVGVFFLIFAVPAWRWLRGYNKRWRDRDP